MNDVTTSPEQRDPPRRFQFSLLHVLAAMLSVCVFLALVTQVRHVGFVIFCYLAGMAGGYWLRRWTLAAASATGLLVFAVTYLVCFVKMGFSPFMFGEPVPHARYELEEMGKAIKEYAATQGRFPNSLKELAEQQGNHLRFHESGEFRDSWDHPFYYQKTGDTFELASLGRDGESGGIGFDADVFLADEWNGLRMRLTPAQFLFETPGSGIVFVVSLLASLATAGIWFVTGQGGPVPARSQIAGAVVTAVLAIVVATVLAAVYISSFLVERH